MIFFGHHTSLFQFLVGRRNRILAMFVSAIDGRARVAIDGGKTWVVAVREIIRYTVVVVVVLVTVRLKKEFVSVSNAI